MATKKNPWPPQRSRFIGGVLYTKEELLELGPDFAPTAVSGVAAKSTPIGSMSDDELKAELERRARAANKGGKKTDGGKAIEQHDPKADAQKNGSTNATDGEAEPIDKMTDAALKAELAAANVEFHHNLGREKLEKLVEEHRAKK